MSFILPVPSGKVLISPVKGKHGSFQWVCYTSVLFMKSLNSQRSYVGTAIHIWALTVNCKQREETIRHSVSPTKPMQCLWHAGYTERGIMGKRGGGWACWILHLRMQDTLRPLSLDEGKTWHLFIKIVSLHHSHHYTTISLHLLNSWLILLSFLKNNTILLQ